jgi:diguanylate cyclase (GGDEF)-like protein
MGKGSLKLTSKRNSATPFLSHASGFLVVFFLAMWLRVVPLQSDPVLQGYLQVTTGLLAFVFAAVTLVRFQGTQDRISLILGSGFLLSGTLLTASSLLFFQFLQEAPVHLRWAPVSWWAGRIVLGLLLVVALLVEHFLPRSRRPHLEIAGALLTVVGLTYLITAALRRLPPETSPHPMAFIPNPQQLLPAAIFLISLVWFRRRLQIEDSAFDRAIYSAAWMNVAAQLAASQSVRLLDSPFVLAQALTVASYAVALGGALLDNARLFEQVQHLAVSDPLTGLANYRRLLDVLESETERTNRNSRPFAVLLLDLDGLKKINDTYGHLVGSRALCRLADTLRIHCRSIDTAARYGGDEFALVLPESQESEAQLVASRIREVLAADTETPPLSASIGISIYSGEGERIEKLLSEADQHLYAEKARRPKQSSTPINPRRRAQKA